MIPGGWSRIPGSDVQHWRRHGIAVPVCNVSLPIMENGSLLPHDDLKPCPQCMRIFRVEAAIALPKVLKLANALAKYAQL